MKKLIKKYWWIGILLLVLASPTLFTIFVETPTIQTGHDGTIRIGKTQGNGYELWTGSIWVDGNPICCDDIGTATGWTLECKVNNPTQGMHTVTGYILGHSESENYEPCNPNRESNLISYQGIQNLKQNSWVKVYERTVSWYVIPQLGWLSELLQSILNWFQNLLVR